MKTRFLRLALIFQTSLIFAQAPSNGLIAHYPFNGNAQDASSNGNNGVVNGATLTSDRFGIAKSAYAFNGTNNSITLPLNLTGGLTNAKQFSFSAYVKLNSTGNIGLFSNWKASPSTDPFGINVTINAKKLSALTNAGTGVSSKDSIHLNTWTHVAVVFDGNLNTAFNRMKLYINGLQVATDSGAPVYSPQVISNSLGNSATNTEIGRWYSQFGFVGYYTGVIDDMRIYNKALTPNDIINLYAENICVKSVAVTDTLRIGSVITGFNEIPDDFGTMKVYPNPTNSQITLESGNITGNYSIIITNSLSQSVYTSLLNKQKLIVNLSDLGGSGLYYLLIKDNKNNVIETKKLILE